MQFFSEIKTGYYLQLLKSEIIKLFGENGQNVSHVETTEGVLVHCNVVIN